MSSRCLKLYHAYSISFNLTNVGTFLELNSKDCIRVQEKKKKVVVVCSTKREIRHFHVVVVQRRQRNVQKGVLYVQSCCFAIINLLLFCRSRCRRRRRCLSSSQTDTWTHLKRPNNIGSVSQIVFCEIFKGQFWKCTKMAY